MPLDLEEQEKVAELKAWWSQYGTMILTVLLAASLGFAGWSIWQWYQHDRSAKASAVYEALGKALAASASRPATSPAACTPMPQCWKR